MASVILNASRGAASAARSAASRCAAAVSRRSGLLVAAASDPPLLPRIRRSSVCFYYTRIDEVTGLPTAVLPKPPADKVEFVAHDKDLESDEAIWALYERWCKFFKEERTHDEMARRFCRFKQTVLRVDRNKKSSLPYRLEINWFADGKNRELVLPKVPPRLRSGTYSFRAAGVEKKPEGAAVDKEPEGAGVEEEPEGAGVEKEPEGAAGEFEKEP